MFFVFYNFGLPQRFVPLRFGNPPLYFSSAGAQFLPLQSPVIKPVQNRSLTFKYFLGSVTVFFSSALTFLLDIQLNLRAVFVTVRKVVFVEVLMNHVKKISGLQVMFVCSSPSPTTMQLVVKSQRCSLEKCVIGGDRVNMCCAHTRVHLYWM